MSSLFQHFTFGFQQLSKLFHDFTTGSYQIQTYAKNSTTVFQAVAQPISAFPAYIHSCIHTYMQACKHAFIHTYMHACVHAYMHTCMHACMLAYIHPSIHPCMHACMHSYTHTYMLACMHTYMHTYIHTCTGLQSWFRIFQQLTVNVHTFFPLPGLVFISFVSSVLCLINFHHCVIVFHFLCSSIFMSSSPVILLALSLHGLYSDICCHQCWSFVIVLFLGFIIFHIYIYIYIVAPPQVFCFKEIRKIPQEDHQTCKIPISILTLQMPFCIKNLNECRK